MAIPFPPLEPIAEEGGRELKLGRFPNRRYEPKNGGSASVRGFGALSVDASLRIAFGVITDEQMAEVWAACDAAQGDYKPLELPAKFFFGIKAELLAKIPPTLEWHFAPGELKYEQVAPGYTRLEPITFIGQLAEQYRNHGAPVVATPSPGFGADGAWVGSGTCAEGIDWGGFNPLLYPFYRVVGEGGGLPSAWISTGNPPVFTGSFTISPTSLAWWGGGPIYPMPPFTSVGGFLGSIGAEGGGTFRSWFGATNTGAPFIPTDPVTFEFSFDGVNVAASWAGVPSPPDPSL